MKVIPSSHGSPFTGKEGGFKIIITWETMTVNYGCFAIGAIKPFQDYEYKKLNIGYGAVSAH